MDQLIKKNKTDRKWNPRSLYFKNDYMSVFTWLAMERNNKKKSKDNR